MKYFIVLGLITGAVWAAKKETNIKKVTTTPNERIDTNAGKVIYKGRSSWEKRNIDREVPKQAQEEK